MLKKESRKFRMISNFSIKYPKNRLKKKIIVNETYILLCFWLLLLLLLGAEEATASNREVRLFFVLCVDILNGFFSLLPLLLTFLLLLLLLFLEPERDASQEADFSSKLVAGLECLFLFLFRFFSSLLGVTGTEAEMADCSTTSTAVSSTSVAVVVDVDDVESLVIWNSDFSSQPSTISIDSGFSMMGLILFRFSQITELLMGDESSDSLGVCGLIISTFLCITISVLGTIVMGITLQPSASLSALLSLTESNVRFGTLVEPDIRISGIDISESLSASRSSGTESDKMESLSIVSTEPDCVAPETVSDKSSSNSFIRSEISGSDSSESLLLDSG